MKLLMRAGAAAAAAPVVVAGAVWAQPAPAPAPDTVPAAMPFDIPFGAPISMARAQGLISAAVSEAARRNWKMSVAVVDAEGELVAFAHMDGAMIASIQIAQHKARAAATFRRETRAFEAAAASGSPGVISLDGAIAARGGVPIVEAGRLIGAIGVSGGAGTQDEVVAKAALATP